MANALAQAHLDLKEQADELERWGRALDLPEHELWRVVPTSDGWRVMPPAQRAAELAEAAGLDRGTLGGALIIHKTPSDNKSTEIKKSQFRLAGFFDDYARMAAEMKRRNGERMEADRLAAEARAQRMADRAAALAKAAGIQVAGEPSVQDVLRWRPEPARWDLTITPAIAEAFMGFNTNNRPESPGEVEEHVSKLRSGTALYTHQGIGFAWQGGPDDGEPVLIDGQTRLRAIMVSGVPWRLQVTAGLTPDVFDVVDTNRRRTAAQSLTREQMPHATLIAGTVRLVFAFHEYDPRDTRRHVPNDLVKRIANGDGPPKCPGDRERFIAAAEYARSLSGRGNPNRIRKANRTAAAAAAYLLWEACGQLPVGYVYTDPFESRETLVDDFLGRVQSGQWVHSTEAPITLRRKIEDQHWAKAIIPAWQELAMWLLAWRDFGQGKLATKGYSLAKDRGTFPPVFLPDMGALRSRQLTLDDDE